MMHCDYLGLTVAGIRDLEPYRPGKPIAELERELGVKNISKLASNENVLGPAPAVIAATKAALASTVLRYPDTNAYSLRQKLANFYHVAAERITVGNGSNDIIDLMIRAFVDKGQEIVISQYAFIAYSIVATGLGAKVVQVPAKNYEHDLDAIKKSINKHSKIVFIANPNNPTGTWITNNALENFMAAIPSNLLVILDEAYAEYVADNSYPDGILLQKKYPNLIIMRTFSKAYGLAGLRVGYAISEPEIADILNRVRQPFNVNTIAQIAATVALDHQEHIQKTFEFNFKEKQNFEKRLSSLGVKYIANTRGNFVTINLQQPAKPIFLDLLHAGVIVRPLEEYDLPNFIRVTIGMPEENEKFVAALMKIID